MQKNATPTREQQEDLKRAGLKPYQWAVIKDLNIQMILRNRVTGEFKVINKK